MLNKTMENSMIDFYAKAEMNGYREDENGPLFIYKEYLPQKIIDLAEAMIREKKRYAVAGENPDQITQNNL